MKQIESLATSMNHAAKAFSVETVELSLQSPKRSHMQQSQQQNHTEIKNKIRIHLTMKLPHFNI